MLALDHIVVAAINVEEASAKYGNKYTIKAIKGGNHENWGTYNYLAYFSNDSYLEWLGVYNQEQMMQTDNLLIQHLHHMLNRKKSGPFQFALRTSQMDQYIEHFNKQEIAYQGPYTGRRQKPDGSQLKWRMLFPEYDYQTQTLPFLIEWENPADAYPDTSLLNTQAITKINMAGIDKESFAHIYQLKPKIKTKKLNRNLFQLQNAKIIFTDDKKMSFELV